MLDHACGNGRHTLAERGHDLYETPPVAVRALLRVEKLPHCIWEPACGHGKLARVLRAAGHRVIETDIKSYRPSIVYPKFIWRDFLLERQLPRDCQAIVTNPPFQLAEQFVAHAVLKLRAPLVIMLLRLAFYESVRRSYILEDCGLARIHVFRLRLPMMHRAEWTGRKANSGMAFAWYVWDGGSGPVTIDRISWEK
jgi:hypothetical protein